MKYQYTTTCIHLAGGNHLQKRYPNKHFRPLRPFSFNFKPVSKNRKKKVASPAYTVYQPHEVCYPTSVSFLLYAFNAPKKAQNDEQPGGPLCEQTENDRDMKISDFVDLIQVDA